MKIGSHTIGDGHPSFIIAEAGVNHNGDADLAKKLVLAAKKTGADCVKFQTFTADTLVTDDAPKANYQLETTDPGESQKVMLKKLELPYDAYKEVIELCNQENIIFFSTAYSKEDIDFLDELDVPAFKFASMHIFEPTLLAYAAAKGRPLVISTGMATLEDVRVGLEAIRETGNEDVVLLQCTTNYPSRIEDSNIRAMRTMGDELDVLVGYSDHTQTDTACITSIALGACVIEKHFTLDKALEGPDQSTSYDPEEFTRLVSVIRETESALGSGVKEPSEIEIGNSKGMRRSIVAKLDIAEGEEITEDKLAFKRPLVGIPPARIGEMLGKKAKMNIPKDAVLTEDAY